MNPLCVGQAPADTRSSLRYHLLLHINHGKTKQNRMSRKFLGMERRCSADSSKRLSVNHLAVGSVVCRSRINLYWGQYKTFKENVNVKNMLSAP